MRSFGKNVLFFSKTVDTVRPVCYNEKNGIIRPERGRTMTEYGIQMYSLRDMTKDDMEGALRTVAALGYRMVEFAGFMGHDAATVAGWLGRFGLTVSGTHTNWHELEDKHFDETVAYHKAIGNRHIIIPGADLSTEEKLDAFIAFVNRVQPKLAAHGISLGYHNHDKEFLPTSYGKIMHTELQNRTELTFEIDTYWAYVAGEDPIALLTRLSDRVPVIHLKDGSPDGKGCALGEGSAPVAAARKKALELGMKIVVESEGLQPTGAEEVARCMRYLATLG